MFLSCFCQYEWNQRILIVWASGLTPYNPQPWTSKNIMSPFLEQGFNSFVSGTLNVLIYILQLIICAFIALNILALYWTLCMLSNTALWTWACTSAVSLESLSKMNICLFQTPHLWLKIETSIGIVQNTFPGRRPWLPKNPWSSWKQKIFSSCYFQYNWN